MANRSCLVMTDGAVVSRLQWWVRAPDVTIHAPSHVERVLLVDLLHVLHLAMTGLARDARIDVTHVREVDVLRQLVNANPRHRLLVVPERGELFNLRFVSADDCVTSHAGSNRGRPWIRRFVRSVVAVQAVDLERSAGVQRVRKANGLHGTVALS